MVFIAASVDEDKDAASRHVIAKRWDQTHHVWIKTEAIKAYHVNGIPTAYVIDRQGKIVAANPVNLADVVHHELQTSRGIDAKAGAQ